MTEETTKPTSTISPPKRKKVKRTVAIGQVHIQATFNNTIITVTDTAGNVLTAASAGACGFRGSKKGTAYAAQIACEKAIIYARQIYGLSKASVFIKGVGLGRDAAIRSLSNLGISIDLIMDKTAIAHGGCRPRKAPRN